METQTVPREARMWAMIIHLSGFASFTAIPFIGLIVPLVIWLLKKEDDAFIDDQGKEAVNYQISMMIYVFISILLAFFCIGFIFLFVLLVADVVLMIIAAVKANDGIAYRYPLIIRFL